MEENRLSDRDKDEQEEEKDCALTLNCHHIIL